MQSSASVRPASIGYVNRSVQDGGDFGESSNRQVFEFNDLGGLFVSTGELGRYFVVSDGLVELGQALSESSVVGPRASGFFAWQRDGVAGDIGFIVDAAGWSQADNCGCLDPTLAATAA